MTTHHRHVEEQWPGQFSMSYVARRAGLSKWALQRRWRNSPTLTAWLEERKGNFTKLTVADLVAIDPALYESIALREARGDTGTG